jgi:hypothetical protein
MLGSSLCCCRQGNIHIANYSIGLKWSVRGDAYGVGLWGKQTLVECVPYRDVPVVSADYECCVVEIVVYNSGVCPSPIRVE